MERSRSGSASSTDSWSLIENRPQSQVAEPEDDLDIHISDEESEVELAEEAYDSYDSDIEVRDSELSESESDSESEEEEDEVEEEEVRDAEEDQLAEDVKEDQLDAQIWCPVEHEEAMEDPESLKYVSPEHIKTELDNLASWYGWDQTSLRHSALAASLLLYLLFVGGVVMVQMKGLLNPPSDNNAYAGSSPALSPIGLQRRWTAEAGRIGVTSECRWNQEKAPRFCVGQQWPFNASVLDEMRRLRRTRTALNQRVEHEKSSVAPSKMSESGPTWVKAPQPVIENITYYACFEDSQLEAKTRWNLFFRMKIDMSQPRPISNFSHKLPEFTMNQQFRRHHFYVKTEKAEFVRRPLGTPVIVKQMKSSVEKSAPVCRRASSAPLPPPSTIRHQPSKFYSMKPAVSKALRPCNQVTAMSVPPKSQNVFTNSNISSKSSSKRSQSCFPKTKRFGRGVYNMLNTSNYQAIGKIAEKMSSKASQLMRKKAQSYEKQCQREDIKTKYNRSMGTTERKKRIAFKQPLPCLAHHQEAVFPKTMKKQLIQKSHKSEPKKAVQPENERRSEWFHERSRHRAANRKF